MSPPGPRDSHRRVPAAALPPHIHHAFPRTVLARAHPRVHQLPGADRLLPHPAHPAAVQGGRLLLRLARADLAPRLHRPHACHHAAAEGLEHVRPTAHRSVQVSGAVSAKRRTCQARHHAV